VAGAVAAVTSLGLLAGGGTLLWAHRTQRDAAGFLSTDGTRFETSSYGLVADDIELRGEGPDWFYPAALIDEARLRVTADDESSRIFVGLARSADVERYLDGVGHATRLPPSSPS
jgi:hypothetical protein